MARQNYGYEKRQKELAKQKKQDAKKQRKLEKKASSQLENQEEPSADAEPVSREDALKDE